MGVVSGGSAGRVGRGGAESSLSLLFPSHFTRLQHTQPRKQPLTVALPSPAKQNSIMYYIALFLSVCICTSNIFNASAFSLIRQIQQTRCRSISRDVGGTTATSARYSSILQSTASSTERRTLVNTEVPVTRISVCMGELCQCQGEEFEDTGGAADVVLKELQCLNFPFPGKSSCTKLLSNIHTFAIVCSLNISSSYNS